MSVPVSRPHIFKRAFLKLSPFPVKMAYYDLSSRLKSQYWIVLWFNYGLLLIRRLFRDGFEVESGFVSEERIDLVILTVSKDHVLVENVLEGLLKHVRHPINKVYVVSDFGEGIVDFCSRKGLTFVKETEILGYGKEKTPYMVKGYDRSGWMFQQLLKLSGNKFVEMKRYLIVDADTVLIRPHVFMKNGKSVFLQSTEWNEPYFKTFIHLFGYEAPTRLSLTSHMMLFDVDHLAEMKMEIEQRHKRSWDEVYRETALPDELSCVSDYETYGNWVLSRHPDRVMFEPLYNIGISRRKLVELATLEKQYGRRFKSLSFHAYIE